MSNVGASETLVIDQLPYNFCLPVNLGQLENEKLRLIPFEEDWARLSSTYVNETSKFPELFRYLPYGPFACQRGFSDFFDRAARSDHGTIIFAIILKGGTVRRKQDNGGGVEIFEVEGGTFAGSIGLLNADMKHSRTEIGHIIILPPFQRTFVGTNAHGLLLRHCLDPLPTNLALRRVQWQANTLNAASISTAQRMGYQLEGIMRWQRVIPDAKAGIGPDDVEGKGLPTHDSRGGKLGIGRHSAMLALCWDDWVNGGREKVVEMMAS